MQLDLSDDEAAALLRELDHIIDGDRFPLLPGIRILSANRTSCDRRRPRASRWRRRRSMRRHERVADADENRAGPADDARRWVVTHFENLIS